MNEADITNALLDRVQQALADKQPLRPLGTGGKARLGRPQAADQGVPLAMAEHSGLVHYEPSELVVTVRAGTSVQALVAALAKHDQMLPFGPPLFGGDASVGGMVASGLAGPRRPWVGSVRDYILGVRLITGDGTHLRFGGEVMKNVAGYDLSRLMAGSFGTLGLITEVSFKVLPRPRHSTSLQLSLPPAEALTMLSRWRYQQGLPLSAASHDGAVLRLRLEGNHGSVTGAAKRIGGEVLADDGYWPALRDHQLPFFTGLTDHPDAGARSESGASRLRLWRLSLPADAPAINLPGETLIDWAGAQRWLKSHADAADIRALAARHGGSATCWTPDSEAAPFHPLPAALHRYHRALKAKLDPHGVFNPGRLYADL